MVTLFKKVNFIDQNTTGNYFIVPVRMKGKVDSDKI